jgi:hypothetical protein
VTAVLEAGGIIMACRRESALYTAEEAREAASGLELATSDEYPHEEITDLIEFLWYGADVLDGGIRRSFHEECDRWR